MSCSGSTAVPALVAVNAGVLMAAAGCCCVRLCSVLRRRCVLTPPRPSPASTNNKGMNQVGVIWCVTAVMCGVVSLLRVAYRGGTRQVLCRGFVKLINRLGLTSSGIRLDPTSKFDITAPAQPFSQLRFVLQLVHVYT